MLDWVSRIDPRQERTILAYSHFYTNVVQHCASGTCSFVFFVFWSFFCYFFLLCSFSLMFLLTFLFFFCIDLLLSYFYDLSGVLFFFLLLFLFYVVFANVSYLAKQINRYLSSAPLNAVFTSMFGDAYRAKNMTKDLFTEKMLVAYQRDLSILEELKYDKRFAGFIGTPSLKRTLLRKTWKMTNDNIPRLLKFLNNSERTTTTKLERIASQLACLNTHALRATSSAYLMEFLHSFARLTTGSSEGCPSIHGETSAEERSQLGNVFFLN